MARRQVSIFVNGKEVAGEIKTITAEKRKLNNEINQLAVGSDEYNSKVKELRKLNGIISDHRKNIGQVESTWTKVGKGLGTFAGIAGVALSADLLVSYGRELFKVGVEMDSLQRKAKIVFGETLPQVSEAAKENAAALGLTASQYIASAAEIQDLLVPMGFMRQEAADISTELVNLSGVLSEWSGGQYTAQESSVSLRKALLGEREELERYGISLKQSEINSRLAAKGQDELTGKARQQAEAMVTLEAIMEKTSDAQRAFAENSDSLARRQSQLNAKFQQIRENLGVALVPVFERLAKVADQTVTGFARLTGAAADMAKEQRSAKQSVEQLQLEFNNEIEVLKRANLSQDERRKLIGEINTKYGPYLGNLISERASINEIEKAQKRANAAFAEKILFLAFQEELTAATNKYKEALKSAADAEKNRARVEAGIFNEREKALQDAPFAEARDIFQNLEKDFKSARDSQIELAKSSQTEADNIRTIYDKLAQELGTTLDQLANKFTETTPKISLGGASNEDVERRNKEAAKAEQERFDLLNDIAERNAEEDLKNFFTREENKLAALEQFEQEKFNVQQELREYSNQYLLTEYENQILQAEQQYQGLIFLAQKYGLDTEQIERAHQANLANIRQEARDKDLSEAKKQRELILQGEAELKQQTFGIYKDLYGGLDSLLGEYEEAQIALFLFNKALAAAEVIINLT